MSVSVLALLIILLQPVIGLASPESSPLATVIQDRLSSSAYRDIKVGVLIKKLDPSGEGPIAYALNPNDGFIPASTTKVLLSAFALSKLGSDFQIQTPVFLKGRQRGAVFHGRLYLVGRGDAYFGREQLSQISSHLQARGIKEIRGGIAYDSTYFKGTSMGNSGNARHYYAPSAALSYEFNWINLRPQNKELVPENNTSYAKIIHQGRYINDPKTAHRPQLWFRKDANVDVYHIKGDASRADYLNDYLRVLVSRPGLYCAQQLRQQLKANGIQVTGPIRAEAAPRLFRQYLPVSGTPLQKMLVELNHNSNNVLAKNLTSVIASKSILGPASPQVGVKMAQKYWRRKAGIKDPNFKLDDLVGLSVSNQVSPAQFSKILSYIYGNSYLHGPLINALPQLGHDAALSYLRPKPHQKVRLKTGTLSATGVNALVGYIENEEQQTAYSVVILMNRRQSTGRRMYKGQFSHPLLADILSVL